MLGEKYKPGVNLGAGGQPFLASQHNEVFDAVNELRAKYQLPATPSSGGSGSGGTATARTGRIYEDLDGAAIDSEGRFTSPDVTFAYEIADSGGWVADTATGLGTAKILFGVSVDIDSTECCGGESAQDTVGLYIDHIDYIDSTEGTGVVFTGSGADQSAEILVALKEQDSTPNKFINGAGNYEVADSAGDWTADSIDLTDTGSGGAFTRGVLQIRAQQKPLGATLFEALRYLGTVYETVASPTPTIYDAPPAPDLVDASDTGDNTTDNRTADTTPTFELTRPAGTPAGDATGPYPVLVIDGIIEATGILTDLDSGSCELTCGSTLSSGPHTAQWLMKSVDASASPAGDYFGAISPPLYFTVDPDTDENEEEPESRRWFRRVKIETVNSETTITQIDNCRSELLDEDEITMVDGE